MSREKFLCGIRRKQSSLSRKAFSQSLGMLMSLITGSRKRSTLQLITIVLAFMGVAFMVFARTAYEPKSPYDLAHDLPRGAFVYAQFSNLPALIEEWNHSQLKERYLNSTNYRQLQHRHLMLKLISRWREFNGALGFQLDTAKITGATATRETLAFYSIG